MTTRVLGSATQKRMGMERAAIEKFLDSGVWKIDPERCVTRLTCAELLARLPEEVTDLIVKRKVILLLAPSARLVTLASPYQLSGCVRVEGGGIAEIDGQPVLRDGTGPDVALVEARLCWIYLAPSLERYSLQRVMAATVETVAFAYLRVTGAGAKYDLYSRTWGPLEWSPDVRRTAELWGFARELASLHEEKARVM